MKQFRITSQDFIPQDNNDCYLDPDDPIHELKKTSQLGGLGSEAALAQYNQKTLPKITTSNKGQIQRELNIKPGTQEWFSLWFSNTGHKNENI